jgi:thiol-disulfide isomerase/thioredoxin
MRNLTAIMRFVLIAFSLFVTTGQSATLKMGDPAPRLEIGTWVQGEPVKELAKGTVYIVDFWATWSAPCRVSIPHSYQLQEKFKGKGLVVIAQDAWEEKESQVPPFLKNVGIKETYRVALDDKSTEKRGAMSVHWMDAAEQKGLPTSFVVDKNGIVAWIGHPMALTENVLEEIIAGTFDIKRP